jgi:hypothetical protein
MHPRVWASVVILGIAAAIVGCGENEGLIQPKGHAIKDGTILVPEDGEHIQVEFVPILPGGKPPSMQYWGGVDQESGIFWPDGPMKKGMPPGKYRVSIALIRNKKDQLHGKFDPAISPFIFDIEDETEEIELDLDNPPPSDIAQQPVVAGDHGG